MSPDVAELMDLPKDTQGILVFAVSEDSPADTSNLHGSDQTIESEGINYPIGGDIIVSINDVVTTEMDGLISYLIDNTRPGDEVALEVIRGAERENGRGPAKSRPWRSRYPR